MSVKEVMSEIETLRNLRHEAILDLKEYYVEYKEKHVYVITEILYGGAVLDAILKMKDERYTEVGGAR
jgi:calcium/calmodulin-dependent protein kinase I